MKTQLNVVNKAIKNMGKALRSSYNEIAWIDRLEQEREIPLSDYSSESFREIIALWPLVVQNLGTSGRPCSYCYRASPKTTLMRLLTTSSGG